MRAAGRIAWSEFRCGTASFAVAALTVAGVVLMVTHPVWSAAWMSQAGDQRTLLILVWPMTLMLAAWHAARERRRGMGELLGSTARPAWQRDLLACGVLVGAAWAAHLLVLAFCAVVLLRQSTMDTPWWAAVHGLALAAYPAAVGLGWAIGRLIPGRIVAPLAGLVGYLGVGIPSYSGSPLVALLPNGGDIPYFGSRPSLAGAAVFGVLWAAVAVTAFLVAGCPRQRLLAIVTGLLVVATLGWVRGQAGDWRWFAPSDDRSDELVCTADTPRVCVLRAHEPWLAQAAAAVRPVLDRSADLARRGAAEAPWDQPRSGPWTPRIDLSSGQIPLWGSRLRNPEDLRRNAAMSPFVECGIDQRWWDGPVHSAWTALLLPEPDAVIPDESRAVVERIRSASAAQRREFQATYFAAGSRCDATMLAELAERWGAPQ